MSADADSLPNMGKGDAFDGYSVGSSGHGKEYTDERSQPQEKATRHRFQALGPLGAAYLPEAQVPVNIGGNHERESLSCKAREDEDEKQAQISDLNIQTLDSCHASVRGSDETEG